MSSNKELLSESIKSPATPPQLNEMKSIWLSIYQYLHIWRDFAYADVCRCCLLKRSLCSFLNTTQKSEGVTWFNKWLTSAFHLYYCYFQINLNYAFSVYINIWLVLYYLTWRKLVASFWILMKTTLHESLIPDSLLAHLALMESWSKTKRIKCHYITAIE